MDYSRRAEITKLAELVLEKTETKTIPIDIVSIVDKLNGILDTKIIDTGVSGTVIKLNEKDKNFRILINASEISERQRFTVGHELGHLLIHMGYLTNPDKWNNEKAYVDSGYYRFGHSEEEHEANQFAAALLMPEQIFRETIQKNMNDKRMVNTIRVAAEFNVSTDAVLTRGKWLGIFSW